MAEQFAIDEIKNLLPSSALAADTWSDAQIAARIDAGLTNAQIMVSFWRYQSAQTAELVTVSESGSTRDIGSIHKNALEQLKYWEDQVKKDKDEAEAEVNNRRRIAFRKAVRV